MIPNSTERTRAASRSTPSRPSSDTSDTSRTPQPASEIGNAVAKDDKRHDRNHRRQTHLNAQAIAKCNKLPTRLTRPPTGHKQGQAVRRVASCAAVLQLVRKMRRHQPNVAPPARRCALLAAAAKNRPCPPIKSLRLQSEALSASGCSILGKRDYRKYDQAPTITKMRSSRTDNTICRTESGNLPRQPYARDVASDRTERQTIEKCACIKYRLQAEQRRAATAAHRRKHRSPSHAAKD